MSATQVSRTVNAPVDKVFAVVADTTIYQKAVPHIISVEVLSANTTGLGARFRETRKMKNREVSTELEITEYVLNEKVRFVSDQGGTIWDSLFLFSEENGQTTLQLTMQAKAYKLMAKLMVPMIKGMVQKAIEDDMDSIKAYCEKTGAA